MNMGAAKAAGKPVPLSQLAKKPPPAGKLGKQFTPRTGWLSTAGSGTTTKTNIAWGNTVWGQWDNQAKAK